MFMPNSERPVNCPYPEPDKFSSCPSSYLKTHFNIIFPSTPVTTTFVFQVYMMNYAGYEGGQKVRLQGFYFVALYFSSLTRTVTFNCTSLPILVYIISINVEAFIISGTKASPSSSPLGTRRCPELSAIVSRLCPTIDLL